MFVLPSVIEKLQKVYYNFKEKGNRIDSVILLGITHHNIITSTIPLTN
jgi:hypothetical protein